MLGEKIAFIGDIHGDDVRLTNLLAILERQKRRLIFLGDYVDHGPNSRKVIEILIGLAERQSQSVFLCGNHEIGLSAFLAGKLSFLEYAWMGGIPTMRSYLGRANDDVVGELSASMPGSHYDFLSTCQPFLETDEFIASHAGVNPTRPGSRDLADVVLARHVSLFDQNIGYGKLVVCGHYLQSSQRPFVGREVICLNTGCGTIGGPATALLYPEMTFLQA